MGLKLFIKTTHSSAQAMVVELSTLHQSNGKDEVVNICLQEASEFQSQVVIPGREHTDQTVHVLTEQHVDIGGEAQNSRKITGQTSTYVEPLDLQRRERGSRQPQGCGSNCGHGGNVGVRPNTEPLLLRVYLAGCSTDDAADKGVAAGQPVAVTPAPHLNGMVSGFQATPVNPCSPHPVAARCEPLSCAAAHPCPPPCLSAGPGHGAQPQAASHPGGGRACESSSFIGVVGTSIAPQASEADQQATLKQRVKKFRGIPLLLRKLDGDTIKPTATTDTGSDSNVISKALVDLLGIHLNKNGGATTTTQLSVLNDMKADTLGTVDLEFSVFCNGTQMRRLFHVVQKIGAHQMLLSAELTMELGHFYRLPCKCHA
ncbi:hypothetical protein G647_07615 [Cladophialophora carrionii CBS 160.54]|uniref:Uncharacterized protein n=1 Tax=Cladophialophora carrionii CBS 160.54 TaxID=1279043 RepID=V9D309_9EURO|nr:uncharacterized protein G647_07615 [Cladophialophora carrionii CBS 160.54]ETI21270.1 hypothetical protein G647_07615 [Cladophialophora carrionii CBS 160.54]